MSLNTLPTLPSTSDSGMSASKRQELLNVRLNAVLGRDIANLTLEDKLRNALHAARFEETPVEVWRKVLPTIPEGVSTMRANEMFCWARSLILDNELSSGLSHVEAHRNTVQRLLTKND